MYDWLHDELVPPALPQAWARLNLGPTAIALEHIAVHGPERGQTSSFRFCEDATSWSGGSGAGLDERSSSLVIISCDKWRRAWNTVMGPMTPFGGAQSGSLWLVDVAESRPVAREFELVGWPKGWELHPLGIDVAADGERLVVVNHRAHESHLEVFHLAPFTGGEAEKPQATYQYSLSHASFNAPNAVAFAGDGRGTVYVSHDHFFTRRMPGYRMAALRWAETILGLPLTRVDVVHFSGPDEDDGARLHVNIAARGIAFANGVVVTRDGKTLAVASTSSKKVFLYDRDPTTHELTYRESVAVPMWVDNLSLAPPGFLDSDSDLQEGEGEEGIIAAGHPDRLSVLKVIGRRWPATAEERWPGSWIVAITKRKAGALAASAEDTDDRMAPVPASSRTGGRTSTKWRVDTLFQSNGKPTSDPKLPPSFMTGTTGVVGRVDGKNWLLQPGLYAEGVRLVRQVLLD